jgi:dihydroorotase
MVQTFDLVLRGGTIVNHDGIWAGDVGIRKGRIAHLGTITPVAAGEVFDAHGLHILPGVIDSHVHFREPGAEYKEDMETGSRAAVMGGVTAVFDMPNTKPPTTTVEALVDKLNRARGRMFCDFAFHIGASGENLQELGTLEVLEGVASIKVFLGSSTGSLLLDDAAKLRKLLSKTRRRLSFHAEDEDRLRARLNLRVAGNVASHSIWRDNGVAGNATRKLLQLARETGARIHVLHVSTAEEMTLLAGAKDVVTVEVTPNHLSLMASQAYARLGAKAQMNPPLRDEHHPVALWKGLRQGVVDTLGSDHAPHSLEEKAKPYPESPSGMPGVQTLVPVMLNHVNEGHLSLQRFVDLTSHGPARVFSLAGKGRMAVGYDADFTIVDMKAERTVTDNWIVSRCGWTPFAGLDVKGWPLATVVRGRMVMRDGEILEPADGRPVRFSETLSKTKAQ